MNKAKLAIFFILICIPNNLFANDLIKDQNYILEVDRFTFAREDQKEQKNYQAGINSKFTIKDIVGNDYLVRFTKVKEPKNIKIDLNMVNKYQNYYISKIDLTLNHCSALSGFDHGTLIVPFKYRSDDGSLAPSSTIGYYIGYTFKSVALEPTILFSGGLTTIPINDINSNDIDTKLGISGVLGVTIEPADKFQIGFFVGVDHIGGTTGDNWRHEDDIWLSFGIGYSFHD